MVYQVPLKVFSLLHPSSLNFDLPGGLCLDTHFTQKKTFITCCIVLIILKYKNNGESFHTW